MKIIPAPLAGWTDPAFRQTLVACGAREVWTEMISATALARGNAKTRAMLCPVRFPWYRRGRQVVQLFGNNPADFVTAIYAPELRPYAEVNLNFGCPAPKIVKNRSGGYLMTDLNLAHAIITAARQATRSTGQKLSVKCRLGWAENNLVAFGQLCARCGVDRLIVHARLGRDGYRGVADPAAVAPLGRAVKLPVIINGDVRTRTDAKRALRLSRAQGVMVGRALCGAPWRVTLPRKEPPLRKKQKIIARHTALAGQTPDFIKHQLCYQKTLRHHRPRP